jgi:hypothetical protein
MKVNSSASTKFEGKLQETDNSAMQRFLNAKPTFVFARIRLVRQFDKPP